MKKFLTLMLTLALTITAVLGLTACGKTSTVDPREGKTITIGYTDYAPMNYTEEDLFMGFDTELAIMTFNALGYNVKFELIEWGNKYVELNSGTIDCIWNGFTSNGEDDGVPRTESVDFSYNYMQNAQCIVRKSSTTAITDFSGLVGKSVAFESGSAGQTLVEDKVDGDYMSLGKISQMDAITAVNTGGADYAIVDILLAQAVCGGSGYESLVINEGVEIDVEYYAVGFKKGSELTAKVNVIFEAFGKTGYLKALAEKYELGTSVITNFDSQK